jgi:hypothetical protein
MATAQVEAIAPVAGPGFRRYAGVRLIDDRHLDAVSEVPAHHVSDGGFHPLADDQDCGWRTLADHLANVGVPTCTEDGKEIISAGSRCALCQRQPEIP